MPTAVGGRRSSRARGEPTEGVKKGRRRRAVGWGDAGVRFKSSVRCEAPRGVANSSTGVCVGREVFGAMIGDSRTHWS